VKTSLTLQDVESLAFVLARQRLAFDEPIPPFETRFPGRLEACLAMPHQRFSGYSPYGTLREKAAILFYLLVKDHPFQNGNKRIALTSMLVFLFINGRWLESNEDELYRLAVDVAASRPEAKDLIVGGIVDFIDRRLVQVNPSSIQPGPRTASPDIA
jgi:death-on-curing family protein